MMLGLPVLVIALLLSAPALWEGFVSGTMSETDALIRFLIAVPVAAVGLGIIRSITSGYTNAARRKARLAARNEAIAAIKKAREKQA